MSGASRGVRAASLGFACLGLLLGFGAWARPGASPVSSPTSHSVATLGDSDQDAVRPPQEIHITARKYSYAPQRIEVQENDLVKVTMETADIPHSFTIDDDNYRIAKRAAPGHPAVFEFRADKAGTFPFYCNLSVDAGCKGMRGELVVRPKR